MSGDSTFKPTDENLLERQNDCGSFIELFSEFVMLNYFLIMLDHMALDSHYVQAQYLLRTGSSKHSCCSRSHDYEKQTLCPIHIQLYFCTVYCTVLYTVVLYEKEICDL